MLGLRREQAQKSPPKRVGEKLQRGYTKFIIDDDVNIRDWQDVIWAMTTRVDPTRELQTGHHCHCLHRGFCSWPKARYLG